MPGIPTPLNSSHRSQGILFSWPVNHKMAEENPDEFSECDLPSSLIVTNIEPSVYEKQESKDRFEAVFRDYDEGVSFHYFKCFRRARVNFSSPEVAARARIHLNETEIDGHKVKCYFVQPPSGPKTESFLRPPPLEKQFLISPPASPPVGWEQNPEAHPSINYDIIAAIAQLAPGQAHELHPPTATQPGIVVHVCEEQEEGGPSMPKPKIVQTKRPEGMS